MFDRAPRARARADRGAKPLAKIRADGELTRKFDNPAIRRLAFKRLGVRAISKKQVGSVFGDMPGIYVPIGWRLRRGRTAGQLNGLRFQPLAAAWLHRLGAAENLPRVIARRVCLGRRRPKSDS